MGGDGNVQQFRGVVKRQGDELLVGKRHITNARVLSAATVRKTHHVLVFPDGLGDPRPFRAHMGECLSAHICDLLRDQHAGAARVRVQGGLLHHKGHERNLGSRFQGGQRSFNM